MTEEITLLRKISKTLDTILKEEREWREECRQDDNDQKDIREFVDTRLETMAKMLGVHMK